MTKIIAVTGPSMVGKSLFSDNLRRIMNQEGHSTNKLIRATTRKPRSWEGEGPEYRFYNLNEMNRMIGKGDVIGAYQYGGNKYGVLSSSLDETVDYNLVSIRDPVGVTNLMIDSNLELIPAILFSEKDDVDRRTTQKMRELDKGEEENIESRLAAVRLRLENFDRELPEFVKIMQDYRFVLFNPNIYEGDSTQEMIPSQKVSSHLAHRFIESLELPHQRLKNEEFRQKYVTETIRKILKKGDIKKLLTEPGSKLSVDPHVLREYSERKGISIEELEDMIPTTVGARQGYGILSIYVRPSKDKITKEHILNIFELQLGMPQHRFEGLTQDVTSPMSMTYMTEGFTNFYMSFSSAYDPEFLHRRGAPAHTLTIEATNAISNKSIKILEPKDAEVEWKKQGNLIRRTQLPYTLLD